MKNKNILKEKKFNRINKNESFDKMNAEEKLRKL